MPDANTAAPAEPAPGPAQPYASPFATALLTDMYELTMLEAALEAGTAHRRAAFEVFSRRLPEGRRYGVYAGVGRLLEEFPTFRFGTEQLDWLADRHVVGDETLAWLADYRFSGTITSYPEGEIYFPHSPLLTVESTFAETVLLETWILSVLNYDTAVASAASRMIAAADGRPCMDMGGRRMHEYASVAAARAAVIGGFGGTANLEAGRRYGLHTIGTAAHAFTLLFDSEREAFEAQIAAQGAGTTLLVDTYDVPRAVTLAIEVAGTGLGAVRIDSGDLLAQARAVRAQLDGLGAHDTRITVTSDLDEYAIAALAAGPVDSYGVGTSLVTGSGRATAGLVYKLVAREGEGGRMVPVAKQSAGKASPGGVKWAARRGESSGRATAEVVGVGEPDLGVDDRLLTRPVVVDGQVVAATGPEAVTAAAERHRASFELLPPQARQLSRGEPCLPTLFAPGVDL